MVTEQADAERKEALNNVKMRDNLNMLRKDNRGVLAEIKADDDLKRIPVAVLTVSKAEEDILKTYNLHANCYITKPVNLEQFTNVVKLECQHGIMRHTLFDYSDQAGSRRTIRSSS